jgi:C-terminal processing protease CtpA/Prc
MKALTRSGLAVACVTLVCFLLAGASAPQEAPHAGIGVKGEMVLRVHEVLPGSPAEKAGLRPQDLVVAVGTKQLESVEDIVPALRGSVGRSIELTYYRWNDTTKRLVEHQTTVTPIANVHGN